MTLFDADHDAIARLKADNDSQAAEIKDLRAALDAQNREIKALKAAHYRRVSRTRRYWDVISTIAA
jgi:hypothetical protein